MRLHGKSCPKRMVATVSAIQCLTRSTTSAGRCSNWQEAAYSASWRVSFGIPASHRRDPQRFDTVAVDHWIGRLAEGEGADCAGIILRVDGMAPPRLRAAMCSRKL